MQPEPQHRWIGSLAFPERPPKSLEHFPLCPTFYFLAMTQPPFPLFAPLKKGGRDSE